MHEAQPSALNNRVPIQYIAITVNSNS